MRYLKDYRLFESSDGLTDDNRKFTDEQSKFLDKYTEGSWSVNSKGLVDIQGMFRSSGKELENFSGISFGEVSGDFWCDGNQLRTLEGCPKVVGGDFWCYENPLISLEEAPEVIEDIFCFKNTGFGYNLESFLDKIDGIKPDEISLLLTHHFFTPEVIKKQIDQNPKFPYYVSLVWNREGFKKTQDELKKILPENILLEIKDFWSIGGYI